MSELPEEYPPCHCGESGYYHCSELREKLEEMRSVIRVVLEAGALRDFAYERGDDDASIYALCKAALKWPGN
jgi:hypothetical protein